MMRAAGGCNDIVRRKLQARRRGLALPLCLVMLVSLGASAGLAAPGADATAREGIPEFRAEYKLERNSMGAARLTRTLRCDDGVCEFTSEGRTVGFIDLLLRGRIEESTRFRFGDDGIEPRDYTYRQSARGDNDEYVRLFFNPGTGRVSSRGDDKWQDHLDGEVMDELLSQLRLMLAVRAGETEMEFTVVEGDGDRDVYRFAVVGEEPVETGAGTYEAVKVERVGGSAKRTTVMWFAPELEFIPLVVRQEQEGGDNYTATLSSIESEPRIYTPGN